jgi:hypothetical protein
VQKWHDAGSTDCRDKDMTTLHREPGKDKQRVGFSGYNSTTLYPSTAKAGNITIPKLSHDDPAKRRVPTTTKSRHGQISNKYEPLQPWPHLAGILLFRERSN